MTKYYTLLLSSILMFSSCNEELENTDRFTPVEEKIDYSTFKAQISDNFVEREILTKASTRSHIGFSPEDDYPLLNVRFDNKTELSYEYDDVSKSYITTSQNEINGAKAVYMYSAEANVDGAIVAAAWPAEFGANSNQVIQLKNMKSRIQVNYKTKIANLNIDDVYIGKIYDKGIFSETTPLVYQADVNAEPIDVRAIQVESSIILEQSEIDEGYNTASYELFALPQNIKSYDTYIKFVVGSKTYTFYLPDTFYVEQQTLYKLTFDIEELNDELIFNLREQTQVKEWELDREISITVNPYQPIWDTWDGITTDEKWTKGDGSALNPYLIEKANHLAYLCESATTSTEYLDDHFKMMININWDNKEWTRVGHSSRPFLGVFDGNGKTIKGARVSVASNNVGLFIYVGSTSATTPAVIKNLNVMQSSFIATDKKYKNCGAIAAALIGNDNINNTIENCKVTSCTLSSGYNVGGIVGECSGSVIACVVENSKITATTTTEEGYGSIAGLVKSNKAIHLTYNFSENNVVDGSAAQTGATTGGMFGYFSPTTKGSIVISNNYIRNLGVLVNDEDSIYGIIAASATAEFPLVENSYHNIPGAKDAAANYTTETGSSLVTLLNAGTLTDGYEWYLEQGASIPLPRAKN